VKRSSGAFVVFILLGLLLGAGRQCAGADFYKELAIQGFASSVDLATTEWALSKPGIVEGHPLLGNRGVRYAMKGTVAVGVAAITHRLETRGKRRAARVVRWGAVALQVGAGAWNIRKGIKG
jgi:hypothetical protein